MGILNLLSGVSKRKKNKNNAKEGKLATKLPSVELEEKRVNLDSAQSRASFITDNCEQIIDSTRQLEEMKVEYQAVTSYLSDMQKIDRIPPLEREQLNDSARKIITITQEQAKYQNNPRKIIDVQFKHLAKYEDIIPTEIKKMNVNETYHSVIMNDMRHLEGEKGSLYYQKEETQDNQTYLKKIAIISSVLVLLLFIVFIIIDSVFQVDIQIPFLMTIVMALASTLYIFTNTRTNRKDMIIIELKLNRAIGLLNKVKIKYINNTNALDYSYQKYMVNSVAELGYLWEQYLKSKGEEKQYKKNTEQIEVFNRDLIKELRRNEVADPVIWIHQAIAIIDNKEMVEIRHRLNVRRQKLREQIDYNNNLKERGITEIKKMITQRPESKEEVIVLLRKFGIDL